MLYTAYIVCIRIEEQFFASMEHCSLFLDKCKELGRRERVCDKVGSTTNAKTNAAGQKRRIKPTLLASFGLSCNATRKMESSHDSIAPSMMNRRLHEAAVEDLSTGPNKVETAPSLSTVDVNWKDVETLLEEIDSPDLYLANLNDLMLISKCLQSAHNLLQSQVDFLKIFSEDKDFLCSLRIVRNLVKKEASVILKLAPSQANVLSDNLFFRHLAGDLFGPSSSPSSVEATRKSSLLGESDSGSDLDALPVAYDDRRDSRNRASHQLSHANQQKLRDQLLDWIRKLAHQGESSSKQEAREIVSFVNRDNFFWLAELLLYEFSQLERQQQRGGFFSSSSPLSRMEKLEERLTKLCINENPILLFVNYSNSFNLNLALQDTLFRHIEEIMTRIIDGNNRQEPRFSNDMIKMISWARLLAACSGSFVGRYEDPVLCFIRDTLLEAHQNGHLLAAIPWILAWSRECPVHLPPLIPILKAIAREIRPRGPPISATRLAIHLLLEAFPVDAQTMALAEPILLDKRKGGQHTSVSIFGGVLDEDESVMGLEKILSICLPEFKAWILSLSAINQPSPRLMETFPLPKIAATAAVDAKGMSGAKQARKVRPITTETPSAAPALQRKLRQWLWWTHPSLKEVLDSLLVYLSSKAEVGEEEMAKVLWKVIPPLLPPSLQESSRMQVLILSLLMESLFAKKDDPSIIVAGL